jgi:hypothetical protein
MGRGRGIRDKACVANIRKICGIVEVLVRQSRENKL